jgi:uncharacterized protein YbgA (DUF1722 family)
LEASALASFGAKLCPARVVKASKNPQIRKRFIGILLKYIGYFPSKVVLYSRTTFENIQYRQGGAEILRQ